jgi:serine-protein kinase ATM
MDRYLKPAIAELKGQYTGDIAGQVLHEFASFCDKQLQNPDSFEDFTRVQTVRDRRAKELAELNEMLKSTKSGPPKDRLKYEFRRAKKWFDLDNYEFQRFKAAREAFVSQSLENYLLSLTATDAFDNDVLRFFSIWLEYADNKLATSSVSKYLTKTPSRKFVVLMNQLSSRLQSEKTEFQKQLSDLIMRMCAEHPYQTLHNIFASSHPSGAQDDAAKSRQMAAKAIASRLKADKGAKRASDSVFQADTIYHALAVYADRENLHSGREYLFDRVPVAKHLSKIKGLHVPAATMSVPLRKDMDYSRVPVIMSFQPRIRIANGLSQPKIITAICSDGRPYKQLVSTI